jgi:hypothetical protein
MKNEIEPPFPKPARIAIGLIMIVGFLASVIAFVNTENPEISDLGTLVIFCTLGIFGAILLK